MSGATEKNCHLGQKCSPNIREKLVEILRKPIFPHELVDPIEAVADYLIDNGVTIKGVENDTVKPVTDCHGCEYCREDFDGYVRMNGAFSIRNSYHREGWTISAGNVKPRQIYYCPMCGRKLPTPPKGE